MAVAAEVLAPEAGAPEVGEGDFGDGAGNVWRAAPSDEWVWPAEDGRAVAGDALEGTDDPTVRVGADCAGATLVLAEVDRATVAVVVTSAMDGADTAAIGSGVGRRDAGLCASTVPVDCTVPTASDPDAEPPASSTAIATAMASRALVAAMTARRPALVRARVIDGSDIRCSPQAARWSQARATATEPAR